MRLQNIIAALALTLVALTACNGQGITVKGPKNSKSTTVTIIPAPTITAFTCVPAQVFEGDSVTCTVTVDKPAPAVTGYVFPVLGGIGNPTTVTILPGQTLASFTFAAVINAGASANPAAAWTPLPSPMHWTQAGVDAQLGHPLPPGVPAELYAVNIPWLTVMYYRFL